MNQEEGREKSWKRRGMMEVTRGGKDAGKGGHQRRSQLRLRKKSLVKEAPPLPEDRECKNAFSESDVV